MMPQRVFRIVSPPQVVGCDEYGCQNKRNGWRTVLPADQADRIRTLRGFSWTEETAEGGLVVFTFPAGQDCFIGRAGMHRLPAEGRERFLERGGLWRGGAVRELAADDWVDSFATNQIRLADQMRRG
jgi:hypothetical protein